MQKIDQLAEAGNLEWLFFEEQKCEYLIRLITEDIETILDLEDVEVVWVALLEQTRLKSYIARTINIVNLINK